MSYLCRSFRVVPALIALSVLLAGWSRAAEPVFISEFLADNTSGLRDEDNEFSDWVEVFNSGTNTVNLGGWFLTDDAGDLTKWVFPSTNVFSSGFVLVFASGKNRAVGGAPLHANFSLAAGGEYLALVKPDGVTIASEFAALDQFPDISYGVGQNVTTTRFIATNATMRYLVPSNGALGLTWTATNFNDSAWRVGTNGVGYETSVAGFAVRNVKANVSIPNLAAADGVLATPSQQVATYVENRNVINYLNTGAVGNYGGDVTYPGFTINVDQDLFVTEVTATVTIPAAGNWTFGVNSDDGFRLVVGSFTTLFDGLRGPGDTLGTFNFPAAGDYALRLVAFENGGGSSVELFAAQGSFTVWNGTNFRLVGDTGNGGLAVRSQPTGVGSDPSYAPFLKTDVQPLMFGQNSSAYVRFAFNVVNAAALTSLTLPVRFDDGFVTYLNGVEVARRNAPASPAYNSLATTINPDTAAIAGENINISPSLSLMRNGANVLAVHALNASLGSSDLLLVAELAEFKAISTSNSYFSTPTPGAVNLSSTIAFVADTKFSHDRGFYSNAFSLVITCATPGVTIYYTTNGAVPAPGSGFTYTAPIPVSRTVCLRAAAFRSGFQPSNVDTHTYLFVDDIIAQQPNGEAPWAEWPAPGNPTGQIFDYGMDPDIVNNPTWSLEIRDALRSLPVFSIVTTCSNLFNDANGIYDNPGGEGPAWERPASLEYILPDGSEGFQENCGVRIRGGFSRSGDNPKHAFRFFFREEYGATKLKYRLFPNDPTAATEFDKIDLRTFQNYSWSFGGDPGGIFMRDVLSRDMQLAMGQQGERGDYCHLYVNGVYWGIFNTDERPEAGYAASYFGGERDDYDVIKVDPQLGYNIEATDGNMDAWFRLWQAATNGFASVANYQRVQGNNPDGSRNPAFENLLDVPNLIDYMLVIFHGGNLDAPISAFLGNTAPNNWYGSRSRLGTGGFRFFAHDSEHTILNVNEDRTGPWPAGDPLTGGGFLKSNPQYIFQQLQANAEFRLLVADRVQKHYFNGGANTVSNLLARYHSRSNQLFRAVVAESARWGDSKRPTAPLTRDDWRNAVVGNTAWVFNRSSVLLTQLRNKGLWPTLLAPNFSQFGGSVPSGYQLTLANPNASGQIYYTLNGSDPRLIGGGINATSIVYSAPIVISQFRTVRARAFDGATWSPIVEANFYPDQDFTPLLLTEIMYNPPPFGVVPGGALEFLEFKNTGLTTLDLSGCRFTNGFTFQFPNGTSLAPGAFFVLASDAAGFAAKYPGVAVGGVFSGMLADNGETLELVGLFGAPIAKVNYNDRAPWPVAPDNGNFSLVPVTANANPDYDDPRHWRASTNPGGSPGADDPPRGLAPILINEALTHTDLPQVDSIELFNPTPTNVNIGGWFLSDDPTAPKKFRIPNGTVIAGFGFAVFTETNFNSGPDTNANFSLSSTGDEVYLLSGGAATNLTGYSHGFSFGAAQNGVSFGRYVNSVGDELFPAQISFTPGATNSGPRVGPVVINEVHYHPPVGRYEFIELRNITATNVPLFDTLRPTNTWKLNGLGFTFPTNITVPASGFVLLAPTNEASFRAQYTVPVGVAILQYPGQLQDSGENLRLQRPDNPNTNGFVPYITVDEVRYNDKLPWPVGADGAGPSLQRLIATAYGNDPINWFASGVTPGGTNFFNAAPVVAITAPGNNATFIPPANVTFTASANDADGIVRHVEYVANGVSLGVASNAPYTVVWSNATPGTYSVVARALDDDGAVGVSAAIGATIFQPVPTTVIARGANWKYLDTGIDQGIGWRALNYLDGSWSNGVAQLGYGDGDEVTVVSFGTNAAARHITTYFRRKFVISNAARFLSLNVNVLRDDGCVVYLNGTEVFRDNMPAGVITFGTLAPVAVGGADETSVFYGTNVNPALLVNGTNILAVEIHQQSGGSSDISFDLELTGTLGPQQPTVNFITPTNNSIFTSPANIPLSVITGDIDGQVVNVDFYSGTNRLGSVTNEPFALTWSNVFGGDYTLRAVARNSGGLSTTSAPIAVRVVTNSAPAVAITSPAELAAFHSPASVSISASATDLEGSVTLVRFFVNGAFIGQSAAAPFTAVWNSPVPGVHNLTAIATDNQNASRTSAVVHAVIYSTGLPNTPTTVIASNSLWRYFDKGVDQGTVWRGLTFNDTGWSNGLAELGYGDAGEGRPEATVIGFGPDVNNRYITTYFRRAFTLSNAAQFASLTVGVVRDDGFVAYLNGMEIFRNNITADPVLYSSIASGTAGGADEATFYYTNVAPALLLNGTNVLAVEMHQAAPNSSDISFNLELRGAVAPPYNGDFDNDGMSDAWELAYDLNPNLADSASDADGDGASNGAEHTAGTHPRDAQSYLRIDEITAAGASRNLRFPAVSNRTYSVLYRAQVHTGDWQKLADVAASATNRTITILDPAPPGPARFYRLATPAVP